MLTLLLDVTAVEAADIVEQPDLSGSWSFLLSRGRGESEELGTVDMRQDGARLEGVWSGLSKAMRERYGFEIGDTALTGEIEDTTLRGRIRLHYPVENRESCPEAWRTWQRLEIGLAVDLTRLQGRFRNSALSPRDCSTEDRGWLFFTLVREMAAAAPSGGGPARPSAGVLAESAFDAGNEGWTLVGADGARPTAAPYLAQGGNPGGYLTAPAEAPIEPAYWDAPVMFLGDRTAAYGAVLLLDLKDAGPESTEEANGGAPAIILAGEGIELSRALQATDNDALGAEVDRLKDPGSWTTHSVRLMADTVWRNRATGEAATEADLRWALSLLRALRIRAEPGSGLDNVVLSAGQTAAGEEEAPAAVEDPVPDRIELTLEELSATVGKAMNLRVFLVNADDRRVAADRAYEIRLTAEGAEVRPAEVLIPEGAAQAAARVYGERPGVVPIRGVAADATLEAGTAEGYICALGPIARVVFNAEREEAPVGRSIGATLHLVSETGTLVSDDRGRKRVNVQIGGVGRATTPNLGWIDEGRCTAAIELVADRPGESPVAVSLGTLKPERRTFRFFLPLTPLVFATVLAGGLLGTLVRVATVWSRARRWKPSRWLITFAAGSIAGLAVFLVYRFGVVEALPTLSGGLGLVLLLGLVGGYLGPTAIERIADRIVPPMKRESA